ncbi:hypothetical protein FCV38_02825 [Clostridium sporogenes]|nr:hypothetical protein [Clostridium sporogenes]
MRTYFVQIKVFVKEAKEEYQKQEIIGTFIAKNENELLQKIKKELSHCYSSQLEILSYDILETYGDIIKLHNPINALNHKFIICRHINVNDKNLTYEIYGANDGNKGSTLICKGISTYEMACFIVNSFKDDRFIFS